MGLAGFVALLLVLSPIALIGGIEFGAAAADHEAALAASQLLAAGDDAAAIGIDRQLAARGGLLHLLDRSDPAAAAVAEQRAILDWATRLTAAGDPDHALALLASVTSPGELAQAQQMRATILLSAAKQAAKAGHPDLALLRLDELRSSGGPAAIVGQGEALRTTYELTLASQLNAAGRAADAVPILDHIRLQSPRGSDLARAAAVALPDTLLAAAREDITAKDAPDALEYLKRLGAEFPGSRAARAAAGLLATSEPATGTLVDKAGVPFSGRVRLGTHFRSTPEGGYITSGPYVYSNSDGHGDFVFNAVAQGGPYVLEVERAGGWLTLIDAKGNPANAFTVTALTPVDLGFVVLPG